MLTSNDLETFGKQISDEHFRTKTPLTKLLAKTAEAQGLSRQQVNRVAEAANVDTYLKLMKTGGEKYINFEVADASVASETVLKKKAGYESNNDYSLPIDEHLLNVTPVMEKIASAEPTKTELLKEATVRLGSIQLKQNRLDEERLSLTFAYDTITNLVKQAVLGGTAFSDVAHVIKTAADQTGDGLVTRIKADLEPRLLQTSFQITSCNEDVREDSKLFQKVAEFEGSVLSLSDKLSEYITELGDYTSFVESNQFPTMHKEAGLLQKAKDTAEFAKNHKVLTTIAAFVPASYHLGKEKGKREMYENVKVINRGQK